MQPSAWARTVSSSTTSPRPVVETVDHALQRVHRHPRAVRAALAGGAPARRRRLEQGLARRELAHAVHQAVVGGDDVFARRALDDGLGSALVEPTTSACATTLAGDSGCEDARLRVLGAQQLGSSPLNSS